MNGPLPENAENQILRQLVFVDEHAGIAVQALDQLVQWFRISLQNGICDEWIQKLRHTSGQPL